MIFVSTIEKLIVETFERGFIVNDFEMREYNQFYIKAIFANLKFLATREDVKEQARRYGNRFFNEHLNSIKLSLPRRNGNTTLALELQNILKNSCLILPMNKDKGFLQMRLRNQFSEIEKVLYTSEDFVYKHDSILRLSKFHYIVLNDMSEMKSGFIDELYTCIVPKAFICLG